MKILDRAKERIEVGLDTSDEAAHNGLMYYGELLLKMLTVGLLTAVVDGKKRTQYGIKYKLVRSSGVGDWNSSLYEITKGPASSSFIENARDARDEIHINYKYGNWQYEAAQRMNNAVRLFVPEIEKIGSKTNIHKLFNDFVVLRNKTRGHGAPPYNLYSESFKDLEESLLIVSNNASIFKDFEWAHLKQNLSGKYRVSKITASTPFFDTLKKTQATSDRKYEDGVYMQIDRPRKVDLLYTDPDLSDFYVANGSCNAKTFEVISYITGNTKRYDISPFTTPANDLPTSETKALSGLDIQGKIFGNIPSKPQNYIPRKELEDEIVDVLLDYRNPVITLVGRGGIGKTSTALTILHRISESDAFSLMIWFSARDIDLLPDGAKPVRPDILTKNDMAQEYVNLISPDARHEKGFDKITYFQQALSTPFDAKGTIFIFDNFETVKDPIDTYRWLNTHVRLPNKIVITTRFRDFKSDYPISVQGMTQDQSLELIRQYAKKIGAEPLINTKGAERIYEISEGHPYIIKILIGEVLREKKCGRVKEIVASRDDLLDALFDRTYSYISEASRRIFLTLCQWNSYIPELAIEAIILRHNRESINTTSAIDELINCSFVERHESTEDNSAFLAVPLTAALFGRKKLSVSPYRLEIEEDLALIQHFGATQESSLKHGITPKIQRLTRELTSKLHNSNESIETYFSVLEFIARRHPQTWLSMADLAIQTRQDFQKAKSYIERFLESSDDYTDKITGWKKMSLTCKSAEDAEGEMHALCEISMLDSVTYEEISSAANRINQILTIPVDVPPARRNTLIFNIARIMQDRIEEADADDCSRLAWLYMHLKDEQKAIETCRRGLSIDSSNTHCQKILQRHI